MDRVKPITVRPIHVRFVSLVNTSHLSRIVLISVFRFVTDCFGVSRELPLYFIRTRTFVNQLLLLEVSL